MKLHIQTHTEEGIIYIFCLLFTVFKSIYIYIVKVIYYKSNLHCSLGHWCPSYALSLGACDSRKVSLARPFAT